MEEIICEQAAMRQTVADRQLLNLDSRDQVADRCMFKKHKFIGDFPIDCRGLVTKIFTDPRPNRGKSDADPRRNSASAVC